MEGSFLCVDQSLNPKSNELILNNDSHLYTF